MDDRILEGELDECPLTLHDIAAIKVSFVNALQGVFHPRVQYPNGSLVEQRPDNRRTTVDGSEAAAPAPSPGNGAETEAEPAPGGVAPGQEAAE